MMRRLWFPTGEVMELPDTDEKYPLHLDVAELYTVQMALCLLTARGGLGGQKAEVIEASLNLRREVVHIWGRFGISPGDVAIIEDSHFARFGS